jgi:hypothetical protein
MELLRRITYPSHRRLSNRTTLLAAGSAIWLSVFVCHAQDVLYEVTGGQLNHASCGKDGVSVSLTGTFRMSIRQSPTSVTGGISEIQLQESSGPEYEVRGGGGLFLRIDSGSPTGLPAEFGIDLSLDVNGIEACASTELAKTHAYPRIFFTALPLCGGGDPCNSFALIGVSAVPVPESAIRFFRRGDVNGDVNKDITDAVLLLRTLFQGGPALPCEDAADANDDGRLDLADAVTLLTSLFLGGGDVAIPARLCGVDPTEDTLTCGGQLACMSE